MKYVCNDSNDTIYMNDLGYFRSFCFDDLDEDEDIKISVSDEDYSDIIDTCDSIWQRERKLDEEFERFRVGEITIEDMDDALQHELHILESKLFDIISKYHN